MDLGGENRLAGQELRCDFRSRTVPHQHRAGGVWATGAKNKDMFLGGLGWGGSVPERVWNWHPIFVVCMVVCLTQALIAHVTWISCSKGIMKWYHLTCQTGAVVFLSLGLKTEWRYNNLKLDANLTSLYSWFEVTAATLICCQFVFGILVYVWPTAPGDYRKALLPLHIFFELAIYAFASLNVVVGIVEKTADQGCGYNNHWDADEQDTDPADFYGNFFSHRLVL